MSIPIEIWKYIAIFTVNNMVLTLQILSKHHYSELSQNGYLNFYLNF